ncbi:MAG TPA: type I methionyl aminopeptidase [Solirubrobacteraceae bacterium]|jgi:methionyl aminopeptidase|nr:type I methionyl aminopeptidase [Solirubrobacteraceae bacterium]
MSTDWPEQVQGLRRAGRLVAATLDALTGAVEPGVTTAELDRIAAKLFAASGARSGPILTYGYPGSICVSVDDEVVHGVPGRRVLRKGQLVTLDVAAELDGYHADAAITVPVGSVDQRARDLIAAAGAALAAGIRAAEPGNTLRDIGAAVETTTRAHGFRVFRELTGHGIGRRMHEDPTVVNWPDPAATTRLAAGMVFTIEPMIGAGDTRIRLARDGWTIRTVDRSRTAHAEHTIMVTDDGPIILTTSSG